MTNTTPTANTPVQSPYVRMLILYAKHNKQFSLTSAQVMKHLDITPATEYRARGRQTRDVIKKTRAAALYMGFTYVANGNRGTLFTAI